LILVDTNVLFDVVTDDPVWYEWSEARLEEADLAGPVVVNDVVYAEFSVRYASLEDADQALVDLGISIVPMSRQALFLAGKVFRQYRAAGGIRTGVLPDFFIGAHAAVHGLPLLTRDPRHYRSYFPSLELIAPD